ncbi:MAG: glycosyltransferase [Chloroflexota bacterium]|nr:glycosyltransferase [Chloroflexota bacterium]
MPEKPLRVVMLTSSYPLFAGDMTAPFIEEIATGLAERGHEVHVVLPNHPRLNRPETERGVHLHPFAVAPLRAWGAAWGYAGSLAGDVALTRGAVALAPLALAGAVQALYRVAREVRADIVHAHWVIPNGPPAALVAKWTRTPLVISLHGSDLFVAEQVRPAGFAARWAFGAADAVTACSGDLADRAVRLGADAARTSVVPYGVNADQFRPVDEATRTAVRAWYGFPPETPLLLCAGRLVYKKGFTVAVDAFAQIAGAHPAARLVIAGDGPLDADLRAQAVRLGIGDRVLLAGRVDRTRHPLLVGACDLYLLPSVHDHRGNVDGLPNALLDALAAGCAVIASDVAGVGLAVRDGETGVLAPEQQADALAAAITALLNDPARRARLGAAARADVTTRLTWARTAATFEQVYHTARGRSKRYGEVLGE